MKISIDKYGKAPDGLFVYTTSNVLVTDEENVEVKEAWRYFDFDMNTWVNVNVVPSVGYKRFSELYRKTDRVYITIPPTELTSDDYKLYEYYEQPTGKWCPCNMDISAFKMQGIETRLKSPIPEAQPLEGVKTAEEILIEHGCARKLGDNVEMLMVASWQVVEAMEAYHAQFSTASKNGLVLFAPDAGGVHPWISVEDRLPNEDQVITAKNSNKGHIGRNIVFKNNKFWHEFTSVNSLETTDVEFRNVTEWQSTEPLVSPISAPSTHSSSEMVENDYDPSDDLPGGHPAI